MKVRLSCSVLTFRFLATQVYHVTGKLGVATANFLDSGPIVERAKYNHVTEMRLDRVIQAWQASHR